jgi:hypothetical protein
MHPSPIRVATATARAVPLPGGEHRANWHVAVPARRSQPHDLHHSALALSPLELRRNKWISEVNLPPVSIRLREMVISRLVNAAGQRAFAAGCGKGPARIPA